MPFLCTGLALVAGSVILLQIALTRVFAITMWHHLAYMVISLALLGFGAAGSLLTARRSGAGTANPAGALAALSGAYGLSVFAAFFLVSQVQVDTLEIWSDKQNVLRLGLTAAAVFVPFFFAGAAVGLALTRFAKHANRLYSFDLLGSALGGAASVWILAREGGSAAVLLAGCMGAAGGSAFALAAGRKAFLVSCLPLALCAGVFAAFVAGPLRDRWQIPFAPGKEFTRYQDRLDELDRIPSSTAEVEVGPLQRLPPLIGGDFGLQWLRAIDDLGRLIGQDGSAPTTMYKDAARFAEMPFLRDTQAASAYTCREATGAGEPKVLVIGVGGGADVMVALEHGARHVTAVEINRAMIDVVSERYDDFLGGLFRPGAHPFSDKIELVHGEGRAFVRGTDERYDVIQMSGVDSFTALSTGAYTLSESYLYTVEAVKDFYAHLEEGGYVNYSRFILSFPQQPRESLRLANIAYTALDELGIADPSTHIAVFRGQIWASTLIKRGAFTPAELAALEELAARNGFWGLVFDPLRPPARSDEPHPGTDRVAQWDFHVAVTERRVAGLEKLHAPHDVVLQLTDAFRLAFAGDRAGAEHLVRELTEPLPVPEREQADATLRKLVEETATRARLNDASFDHSLECYSTLLRGTADERAAFVAGYEYDLSPCTDDDPFFFNYYRYRNLLKKERSKAVTDLAYTHDYPVGHVVLVSSLLQITLVALLLILLPLARVSRRGAPTGARIQVFLYFAALGAGFMFVEIVLMQKMVLFLGHPTHAVTVVLTALLAFAGLGSLLAARFDARRAAPFRWLALVVPLCVLLEAALVDRVLPELLGLPFAGRVAAVVALLAPLGLVLGMPFPLGLRRIAARWPELLPWAWAINAFLSVFTSIFCILLGMALGFSAVLVVAAFVYAAGLVVFAGPSGDGRARAAA